MDQRLADLYAAVARQALRDFRDDYHHPKHMDAATWLRLVGLLTDDGELDYRGINQRRRHEEQPLLDTEASC